MAENRITTRSLWKATTGTKGTNIDSDIIDLRDISKTGNFSLSYTIAAAGGAATCGSSKISFLGCTVYDGTYQSPTNGTFATLGDTGGTDIVTVSPPVIPFMKIRVALGTSGNALVTGNLHVR
jgi:hypothetical protein